MIGAIAGDIISSPYRRNPIEDTSNIFFPLFATSDKVVVNADKRRASTYSYEAKPGILSGLAKAAADWYLHTGRTAEDWNEKMEEYIGDAHPSGIDLLAVCGPLVELSFGQNEALQRVGTVFDAVKAQGLASEVAVTYTRMLSVAAAGGKDDVVRAVLNVDGYSVGRSCSEMRPFLIGLVKRNEDGSLGMGDGKAVRDAQEILPAVFAALHESSSYEEAVRRATAVGGDCVLIASLTGALAEQRWPVPDHIRSRTFDYFSDMERALVKDADRLVARRRNGENVNIVDGEAVDLNVNGTQFSCIRMKGYHPVYVIPEGRADIEAAVRSANRKLGYDYEIIRPGDLQERLAQLSAQLDRHGNELSGTYLEHARPEVKPLWYQKGRICTAFTREGEAVAGGYLPSKDQRAKTFNEFQSLKVYVSGIRAELERQSGFVRGENQSEKLNIHFQNAFYPVVKDQSIELWKGDILRGRAFIDANGRFSVDTNALTGSVGGEYLQGVLDTMNIFQKFENMTDVKLAIAKYCLDDGMILDEDERSIMKEGDPQEVEALKNKYQSNVDRAMLDLSGEVGEAQLPSLSKKDVRAMQAREERIGESVTDYEGLSASQVLNAKRFPGSIFTVGCSNHTAEEFNHLMKEFGIDVLIDIRAFRTSKFNPQFNENNLDSALEKIGVEYHSVPVFCARQYEGEGDDKRLLSFEQIMEKPEFREKLSVLREGARSGLRIALMSSEGNPLDSSRFVMMGRALSHPEIYDKRVKPVDVQHITRTGNVVSQSELEGKMLVNYGAYKSKEPINISFSGNALAKALTNPGFDYPISYKDQSFKSVEHAYQTWKTGRFSEKAFRLEGKRTDSPYLNQEHAFGLMTELIGIKLETYPSLVKDITNNGGVEWLLSCTHEVKGDPFWESKAKDDGIVAKDAFIKSLANAYMNVTGSNQPRLRLEDSLEKYRVGKGKGVGENDMSDLNEAYRRRETELLNKNRNNTGISLKFNQQRTESSGRKLK